MQSQQDNSEMLEILMEQNNKFLKYLKQNCNLVNQDLGLIKRNAENMKIKHRFDHFRGSNKQMQLEVSSDEEYHSSQDGDDPDLNQDS